MYIAKLLLLLSFSISFNVSAGLTKEKRPNILFIMIDDLRVELGAYGAPHIQSPNIDALANSGTRFDKAYVSVPVCGASRASLATGMRPLPDRFRTYYSSVDKETPEAVTLFEHFKDNGYFTEGYGKIFHQMRDTEQRSWSAGKVWNWRGVSPYKDYQLAENIAQVKASKRGPATEMFDGPDNAYLGGKLADKTIKTMTKLAKKDQPFFFSSGLYQATFTL
jgi:arylsulfatase A-like enzyme